MGSPNSDGLPDATYYETMGPGPQLFAVVRNTVYYHAQEKWFPYNSASNIVYGIMNIDDWQMISTVKAYSTIF